MMNIDSELLNKFEAGLDPQNLNDSSVPAVILGFGEISTVFQIGGCIDIAYKRMPLFNDIASAEKYAEQYREYCCLLSESGLKLPESETGIVALSGRPVVLYIAQKILPPERFAHKLIHVLNPDETGKMMEKILSQIELVWSFNREKKPLFELALDGQLSNWVFPENLSGEPKQRAHTPLLAAGVASEIKTDAIPYGRRFSATCGGDLQLYFVDTSTPLFRKNGVEQLDPELLLQSAPGYLRWMLRLFFLDDVMNRYYDKRQVCIDLAANLYKEQKPEMVPFAVEMMNGMLFGKENPLSAREVEKYYGTDRKIWALFLAFRRIDRFFKTRIFMKRYEFILPGKIKR